MTRDTDVWKRSFMKGFSLKIIPPGVGIAETRAVVKILQNEYQRIQRFTEQQEVFLLILPVGE